MTVSPQELLQRHGIAYVATKKGSYTTKCPSCGSQREDRSQRCRVVLSWLWLGWS